MLYEGDSRLKICGTCAKRVIPWATFPHNYKALISCASGVQAYAYEDDEIGGTVIVKVRQRDVQ